MEISALSGVWLTPWLEGGRPFDIENVLAYNVGMAAFARTGQRGMCFERIWAEPPSRQPGLSFDHHHTYRLAAPPSRPSEGLSLTVDLQESDLRSVARVWWAVSGAAGAETKAQASLPITGRFALHVEIGMVGLAKLHQVIKVLLDGLVAGLQADSAPDPEAVARLSRRLSLPADEIVDRLQHPTNHLIHSDGRLVLPYRKEGQDSLQWHPADHRCESIAVVATGLPGLCRLTVTELGVWAAEEFKNSRLNVNLSEQHRSGYLVLMMCRTRAKPATRREPFALTRHVVCHGPLSPCCLLSGHKVVAWQTTSRRLGLRRTRNLGCSCLILLAMVRTGLL